MSRKLRPLLFLLGGLYVAGALSAQAPLPRRYTYDAMGNRLSATGQVRFTTPAVFFFEPQTVLAGDRVNIFGRNFPFQAKGAVSVAIGGKAAQVLSVAPNVITFVVPAGTAGGALSVTLPGKKSFPLGALHVLDDDEDRDCIPLPYELALGLDPANRDSDGDGTSDGDEDSDRDGLSNCFEVVRGLHPGKDDSDEDRLLDGVELTLGTDPLNPDSDADGFLDGEEVEFRSDPKDALSLPIDPDARIREVIAGIFAVENAGDPSGPPIGDLVAAVFSLLNQGDPLGPAIGDAVGPVFSVLNDGDPMGPAIGDAVGGIFSVLNDSDPGGPPIGEAVAPAVSVKNNAGL